MKRIIIYLYLLVLFISCHGQAIELVKHPTDVAGYSAEYQSVYDAFTSKPDASVAAIWNTFVTSCVGTGEWLKFDALWIYAAHTNATGEALINWISPGTYDATLQNAPTFTAYEGFTGNDVNTAIKTGFNLTTHGVKYTLNDCSVGIYIRTENASAKPDFGVTDGTNLCIGYARNPTNAACRINNNSITYVANTDSRGFYIMNRTASNVQDIYKNGVLGKHDTDASVAIPNEEMYVLCFNDNGASASSGERQASMFYIGSGMTTTNITNITNYFEIAMDAFEKGIIP